MSFTEHQLNEAFAQVQSGADFPKLLHNLFDIGVIYYENFVTDGQCDFYGREDFLLKAKAKYSAIAVNEKSDGKRFKKALKSHQHGDTDYLTFCKDAADCGITRWITNTTSRAVAYYNAQGDIVYVETAPIVFE